MHEPGGRSHRNLPGTRFLAYGSTEAWEPTYSHSAILGDSQALRGSGSYNRTSAGGRRTLPASSRPRYAETTRANLRQSRDASIIDDAFAQAQIQALVVKGFALVQVLYGDPGMREMADIVLLVRPDHEDQAVDVLLGLGYTRDRVHPTVFTCQDTVLDVKPEPFGISRIQHRRTAFSEVVPELWNRRIALQGYKSLETWSVPARIYTLMVHGLKHGLPGRDVAYGPWRTNQNINQGRVALWHGLLSPHRQHKSSHACVGPAGLGIRAASPRI